MLLESLCLLSDFAATVHENVKFKWKQCWVFVFVFLFFSTRITPSHWLVRFYQIWSCCYALQAAAARLPCGFVALSLTDADWERLINPRAAASLWRPQSGKKKNHWLCDINAYNVDHLNIQDEVQTLRSSIVINRGWHFHSSRLNHSVQALVSLHISITMHKSSPKCPNLFRTAFWSTDKS